MKIELPKKRLNENTYDIREDENSGILFVNDLIDKIYFNFSESSLIMNLTIKEGNFEIMEMKINDGALLLHGRSRVGILNVENRHYLLPETFWEDFISVVIPLKFIKVKKCDSVSIEINIFEEDKKSVFVSEKLQFQIKIKGETCTRT